VVVKRILKTNTRAVQVYGR